MAADEHLAALRSYDAAIAALYDAPLEQRLAGTEEEAPTPASDDRRVAVLLDSSRALTTATAGMLQDDDVNVRASGQARLAALAAKDIAIAFDIARLDEDERTVASANMPLSVLQSVESEVAFVLQGDPRRGVPALPEQAGGTQLASAAQDPCSALRAALPRALEDVRDDATSIVVGGMGALASNQLGKAMGALASGLLRQLPDKIKRWYRWAVELLKEGIRKLRSLLGEDFDRAVKAVEGWLQKYSPKALADRVYGVPALSKDLEDLVDKAASASVAKDWANIEKDIEAVVGKFESVKKVVLAVFKAIGFARDWVLRAVAGPSGEILVDGAFVLGGLFGLFAGGDYIDWRRTKDEGAFDFVCGVRRTAEAELG